MCKTTSLRIELYVANVYYMSVKVYIKLNPVTRISRNTL